MTWRFLSPSTSFFGYSLLCLSSLSVRLDKNRTPREAGVHTDKNQHKPICVVNSYFQQAIIIVVIQ